MNIDAKAVSTACHAEILLIHGLGCQGSVWNRLVTFLSARQMTCLAPTLQQEHRPRKLRGQLPPGIGLADYVCEVRALCHASLARTGQKPIVIGHSMGGLIAQIIAAEGHCSKTVFLTPAPPKAVSNKSLWMLWCFANVLISGDTNRYHKGWQRGISDVLLNTLPRARRAGIYRQMVFEPGQLFADMTEGVDVPAEMLRIPSLTVAAARDRAVPASVVRRIVAYYASAPVPTQFKVYRHSGHWLMDDQNSATLFHDLAAWIEAPVTGQ